jgi:excisionase family DNA binding protein
MQDSIGDNAIPTANDKSTITEKEFCSRVGISRMTAYRLREAGRLSHCRIGDKILYLPRHIDEFLASVERRAYTEERR